MIKKLLIALYFSIIPATLAGAVVGEEILQRWNCLVYSSWRDDAWWVVTSDLNGKELSAFETNLPKSILPSPVFSPDGKQIAYVDTIDGSPDVFLCDLVGQKRRNITNSTEGCFEPVFSPDSQSIAFVRGQGSKSDICIISIDGSSTSCITKDDVYDTKPYFSPDGTKLAYESYYAGQSVLVIHNVNGKHKSIIKLASSCFNPSFLQDGRRVVFTTVSPDYSKVDIASCALDGTKIKEVTQMGSGGYDCKYSPDGKMIVFAAPSDDVWDIYIISADGGDCQQITRNVYEDKSPSFAPFLIEGRLLDYYGHWHLIDE